MTPEEKRQRALRAEEVLNGASWVFDELVANGQRGWIVAPSTEAREKLHDRVTAALELKAHLLGIVKEQKETEAIDVRRNPDG